MRKPLIAITGNYQNDEVVAKATGLGTRGQDMTYAAVDYSRAIERAGGIPVFVPQYEDFDHLDELLEMCDGILISGGHDVDPLLYGEVNQYSGLISVERDALDVHVAKYALEHRKPVLGICRGNQIMNVACGGTLFQDLPKQANTINHSDSSYPRNKGWHHVTLVEGSKLAKIYGKTEIMVNSYHHQAVRLPGRDVTLVGTSPDGVNEAIEINVQQFAVGVQWHPEMMFDSEDQKKLFKAFVESCDVAESKTVE